MTSPALSESGGRSSENALQKTRMYQTPKNKEKIGEDPTISTDLSVRLIADNTPTLYLNEREELDRCIPY